MNTQIIAALLLILTVSGFVTAAGGPPVDAPVFPPELQSCADQEMSSIIGIMQHRIRQQPFNLVASLIFLCAIVHTFLAGRFMAIAHRWAHDHEEKIKSGRAPRESVHHGAELFHLLNEIEAVFGIWAAGRVGALVLFSTGPRPSFG
ncbi:MAG TPA: putative Na+/H+ antiporter [Desulfosarcina sp.]|nr:putative Na+/H+ antiporter [Desulfosarcina sp.]